MVWERGCPAYGALFGICCVAHVDNFSMDRLLQLGAGGLPGMGQVRRLYSFKSFHSRLQGLSYIDHTLSVGPQQPLPKPPVHLSEKLHYEFNSLAKWTSSIPTKRISSYKTKYLDKSVGHPHSMCADCQKSENFFNFPPPPPPQPPPGVDAPMMDTAEMVYISSLALLKVQHWGTEIFETR